MAGPIEATAMGNVLVQAMGVGQVGSLAEAHAIARTSADLVVYEPRQSGDWDRRMERLRRMRLNAPVLADLQSSGTSMHGAEKQG
jgi:rhamnulokinase